MTTLGVLVAIFLALSVIGILVAVFLNPAKVGDILDWPKQAENMNRPAPAVQKPDRAEDPIDAKREQMAEFHLESAKQVLRQGNKIEGRWILEQIVKQSPNTKAGREAKRMLGE